MQSPTIIPDRDRYRKWYLDDDICHTLHNGDVLNICRGYRFDAHSVPRPFRWIFPQYDVDIYAALIHDFLCDTSPWHRYNRSFIDREYTILMDQYSSGLRKFWMPKAVWLYGFLFFTLLGDYRGEPKSNTQITVSVRHDLIL